MKEQRELFRRISEKIHKQGADLVKVIVAALGVSESTARRRINCQDELSLSEVKKLYDTFNISIDEILCGEADGNIAFHHHHDHDLDISNQKEYIDHLQERVKRWNEYKIIPEKELLHLACHLPFYHCYQYDELIFFRLFTGNNIMHSKAISYDTFCKSLEKNKLIPLYRNIHHAYLRVPSKEIWSTHTIDLLLQTVKYYYLSGAFKDTESALRILRQAKELLDTVRIYAEKGYKDKEGKVAFSMYLSPINMGNSITLAKNGNDCFCNINLYLNNSMGSHHRGIYRNIQQYFDDATGKSMLVSGGSSKSELSHLFRKKQDRIDRLIDRIESGRLPKPPFFQ